MNPTTEIATDESRKGQAGGTPVSPKPQKEIPCEVLAPSNYFEWDDLVDRSPHGTVFHYSWWLQTTAKEFALVGTRNEKGRLVAGLPIPFPQRRGLKSIDVPVLTPYLGPIFDLSKIDTTCDQLHFMRTHGEVLASNLEPFDHFRCVTGPRVPDLQGFLWMGFRASLGYTERFPATHSVDQILKGMSAADREDLRKALRLNLNVACDEGIEDLLFLNHKIAKQHGKKAACPADVLNLLWNAAYTQDRAHTYVARTSDTTPIAALLVVQDNRTTYQILSAVNPEFEAIPALHLISWTALQDCLMAGRDFEFIDLPGPRPGSFSSRWGATSIPTWRLEKAGSWRAGLFQSLVDRSRQAPAHS